MGRLFEHPMSRPRTWFARIVGTVGLIMAIVSPFKGPSASHRAVDSLAGLFLSGLLFVTLGRKWNLFAFAVGLIGMIGFAGVYGVVVLSRPSPSLASIAVGVFCMFAVLFFGLCVVVGAIRWLRTGSVYTDGKVIPFVASGPYADAADILSGHGHGGAHRAHEASTPD